MIERKPLLKLKTVFAAASLAGDDAWFEVARHVACRLTLPEEFLRLRLELRQLGVEAAVQEHPNVDGDSCGYYHVFLPSNDCVVFVYPDMTVPESHLHLLASAMKRTADSTREDGAV